eukprot:TRINITY_DN18183_c0_g1_i3.p1 TRINITY_DN18183_c0_g1~~TRINITY_DN18183_c0_g1_i3.p1  ORF type:complete len:1189 (-),score=156.39 TRINITY_DN18183_c0_g1_i3:17862-21428(-)
MNNKSNLFTISPFYALGLKKALCFKLFLSLLLMFGTSFSSFSQSAKGKISLKFANVSFVKVFDEIERQTDYYFSYDKGQFDENQKVSIEVKNADINKVMTLLLEGKKVEYKLDKNSVIIRKKVANRKTKPGKLVTVTGVVTDINSTPLPGVNITVKNELKGVITNFDGEYTIQDVSENCSLLFSFIGMKTKEVSVKGKSKINIQLEEDAISLDEVVAVGYGTIRKSDVTGSVASVSAEAITQSSAPQVEEALQGRIAGVELVTSDNAPGAGMEIRIRGTGSLNASSAPLYVIDGFPIESSYDAGSNASSGGQSPLAGLSPSDIESIDILKDASATAIYGARGANGVVIITTKGGSDTGKLNIEYSGRYGVQEMIDKYEMMNSQEYAEFKHANTYHLGRYYHPTEPSEGSEYWNYKENFADTPTTDWLDLITQQGIITDHNLSISGGTKKTNFAASVGYYLNEGIVKKTDFERYTLNLKLNANPNKVVSLGINTRTAYTENNGTVTLNSGVGGSYAGIITSALSMRPVLSPFDENGDLMDVEFDEQGLPTPANPLINIHETMMLRQNFSNYSNAFIELKPLNSLKFRSQVGLTYIQDKFSRFVSSRSAWGRQKNGEGQINSTNKLKWLSESTISWNKTFNKKHRFNVLGGFSLQGEVVKQTAMAATDFPIETLGVADIGAGASFSAPFSYEYDSKLMSYLGRFNYSFDNKYLLTVSYRADGSSKFSKNNKWGYFPSAAIAWRISEEKFLENTDWLGSLKLRLGWGQTGNPNIAPYQSLSTYGIVQYPGSSGTPTVGVVPNNPANDNLKWETSEQTNAGIDIVLFDGRVNFAVDAYYKRTRDLLLKGDIASSSGYQRYLYNSGRVDNKGLEFALNTVNFDGKFKWFTDINVSINRNEVVDLGRMNTSGEMLVPGTNANDQAILIEGQPIGLWYGYVTDGIWKQEDFNWNGSAFERKPVGVDANGNPIYPATKNAMPRPGERRFKDISGPNGVPDGVINDYDKTVIGRSYPKATGGINNRFEYKNFDFSVFMEWSIGKDVYNFNRLVLTEGAPHQNRLKGNYYMPPQYDINGEEGQLYVENGEAVTGNPDGTLPLFGDAYHTMHDAYIEDGSYLKVKNMVLGYTFPKQLVKKLKLAHVRIYGSVTNPFIITNYSGYDPTVNAGMLGGLRPGMDRSSYPLSKTYTLGVNVKF